MVPDSSLQALVYQTRTIKSVLCFSQPSHPYTVRISHGQFARKSQQLSRKFSPNIFFLNSSQWYVLIAEGVFCTEITKQNFTVYVPRSVAIFHLICCHRWAGAFEPFSLRCKSQAFFLATENMPGHYNANE